MKWLASWRADGRTRQLADRHYNRQHLGAPQFVPPGRCLVLRTQNNSAAWITSWPFAEYTKHAWAGAWVNSMFRNEDPEADLSSDLIRQAVSATRDYFGEPPALGMISFVDASKVRRKREPGRCYKRAGFRHAGYSEGGLWCWQMLPCDMPRPEAALDEQLSLAQ